MRNYVTRFMVISLISCSYIPLGFAQPQSETRNPTGIKNQIEGTKAFIENQQRKIFVDPLSGIVINRTVTVQGHDFYQFFSTMWRAKGLDTHYTIAIYERPSARWGSEIWVEYRRQQMFHTFLPLLAPKHEQLVSMPLI